MARIYLARDDRATLVSRRRLRMVAGRPVRHPWKALVETDATARATTSATSPAGMALVVGPPVLAGAVITTFAPVEIGIAAGGAVFFAMSYLSPVFRRYLVGRGPRATGGETHRLTAVAERAAFDRVLATADRISETWPGLGSLLEVVDAEAMLADALWEIAGVLARREELSGVLTELSRPDFLAANPSDETARELRIHRRAARLAMAQVESELAAREGNLRRVEQAGRNLVRELEMRRAIRAAEQSLRTVQPAAGDPAAELAEHTQSVLTAYRELTSAPPPLEEA
jgi:hypothetical protein